MGKETKYSRPSTSKTIYGHKNAGRQAYKLFEELAEFMGRKGEVHISRTMRSIDDYEYPPVYKVWYKPYYWKRITREEANELYDIGDKYGCKVIFASEGVHVVALFDDGGTNFEGN